MDKEIAELRNMIRSNRGDTDVDQIELCHREIKNELILRREQVTQLRKELDGANAKVFVLNRQLESTRSLLKETDFNLKLALNKSSTLEEKMKEINDAYVSLKLKEELRMSEIAILNDYIQKIAHEKNLLSGEVDELKDILKFSEAFQDEAVDRQNKINVTAGRIKESMDKLQMEHSNIEELHKKLKGFDEFKNLCQLLTQENLELRQKFANLEYEYIESRAKCDMLSDLKTHQKNDNQWDILERIKFLTWESRCKYLEQKNLNHEEIISKLTKTVNEEVETNAKLILANEELQSRNEELEKKLTAVKVKVENEVVQKE